MIGADLPMCVVTAHVVTANQDIHDGLLEGVTHVQPARHIRGWKHDAIGRAAVLFLSRLRTLPMLTPVGFNVSWVQGIFHGSVCLFG